MFIDKILKISAQSCCNYFAVQMWIASSIPSSDANRAHDGAVRPVRCSGALQLQKGLVGVVMPGYMLCEEYKERSNLIYDKVFVTGVISITHAALND